MQEEVVMELAHHVENLLESAKPGKSLLTDHKIDVWVDVPDNIRVPVLPALRHVILDMQIINHFCDLIIQIVHLCELL